MQLLLGRKENFILFLAAIFQQTRIDEEVKCHFKTICYRDTLFVKYKHLGEIFEYLQTILKLEFQQFKLCIPIVLCYSPLSHADVLINQSIITLV